MPIQRVAEAIGRSGFSAECPDGDRGRDRRATPRAGGATRSERPEASRVALFAASPVATVDFRQSSATTSPGSTPERRARQAAAPRQLLDPERGPRGRRLLLVVDGRSLVADDGRG